ncbi:L-glutamate gamma-semialdehyde dehydrogenase [Thermosipho melanesiensis]|uniref:L-glutamate gamma-semialdehyde dehydrogenase n=1 Tax=Thermosipho melanesiensis (strain DSM 12029 / CIP 104789 / BI429) TaxID=391009 RepID=A6LIZ3_THEM4|nr:L-glutamate gamma-semialdehyde dehydrogenase [Thermosipho melanesiensis]ABR29894.1 putative delta-1-pyrroline-5-carboxylate dehydrogenase [Thermosipho melanesiensis BI429]
MSKYYILKPFKNLGIIDFNDQEIYNEMKETLKRVESEFGKRYPIVIGGKEYETGEFIRSINPSKIEEVVGYTAKSNEEIAEKAVETAFETFKSWSRVPAWKRAEYLLKTSKILRDNRFEFVATMVYEVGKNWVEADADFAEAVDFLEFYAREMLRYDAQQPLVRIETEKNDLNYIPMGVGAIIPPWNFPLAILVGMTSAAVVTGNTVVLKPASDSTVIAAKFVEALREAGLPDGVVNFLPGSGAVVGEYLVKHPKIRFISFTGSKEVGLKINELAAKPQKGQMWIKRVVLEMGGKDAVVVDETADLDFAAEGIVVSAFGFQGQKCSAGSRAIIVEDIYDKLVEKIVEKTKEIKIGDVRFHENWLGPVINSSAKNKIMNYIEIGKNEGKLIFGGKALEELGGYFIQPTIFKDVPWNARIAQEEIFGPVLSVIKAKDFDEALKIANSTEYGLTGSLYSKSREHIERAKVEFHVGNLYFNRKCTGALVGVHPFGGFNMSGTDSKAGGRDYLGLFLQAKVWSEKIL